MSYSTESLHFFGGRLRNETLPENQAFALVVFGDSDRLCHQGKLPQQQEACQMHAMPFSSFCSIHFQKPPIGGLG